MPVCGCVDRHCRVTGSAGEGTDSRDSRGDPSVRLGVVLSAGAVWLALSVPCWGLASGWYITRPIRVGEAFSQVSPFDWCAGWGPCRVWCVIAAVSAWLYPWWHRGQSQSGISAAEGFLSALPGGDGRDL